VQTCHEGDRVTDDGVRFGVVLFVIVPDRRGLEGGSLAEARVEWQDGERTWESVEDLHPEVEPRDARP
jgi:hypothetical protein